jgi:cation diffusion facilitator CzcD-associated flavoprotein CzcO
LDVAIVGAGFSGLGMAIRLAREGRSFVILEKAQAVGGTWRDNRYPGAACDVPSPLYSFSFEPNPGWSRMFSPQAEILEYLERCVEKYGLAPHLRLGTEVTRAVFSSSDATWRVEVAGGEPVVARHLVLGLGPLSRPLVPEIAGLARFKGRVFHSARWPGSASLAGERVAVIGTGASAAQLVPPVAEVAARLHLFQRTPSWILPKNDRPMTAREKALFRRYPLTQRALRAFTYWTLEALGTGFTVHPVLARWVERVCRKHIAAQISDEKLRDAVTPRYRAGCKRVLLSNDFYPALARENVELVTAGIREITEDAVVGLDGIARPVDTIILATGFRATDLLTPLEILGRSGVDLNDRWRQGIEAYLGTTVSGFPNLYLLLGPNTILAHSSVVFMLEAQIDHVVGCLREAQRRRASSVEVDEVALRRWNEKLHRRLSRAVWASGCSSWYLDENGRNPTLWPGPTFEFWLRTRRFPSESYRFS